MGNFSFMTNYPRSLFGCTLLSLLLVFGICSDAASANASASSRDEVQFEHVGVAAILDNLPTGLSPSERIPLISSHFLNTPYKSNTLIGGPKTPERLVADLTRFDCFTFLDTVEALRRSAGVEDFIPKLVSVRYKNDIVSYQNRRHFFSDWVSAESGELFDVTGVVGQGAAVRVLKTLNKRADGTLWLEGLPATERALAYLPSEKISEAILWQLRGGDYVGIYTEEAGLDVQHTGIIIKRGDRFFIRHASSSPQSRQVVDDDLLSYLRDKKGLIIFRVRADK